MKARRILVLALVSILTVGLVVPLVAKDDHVSGTANGEWRHWGGDERSSRYSPLDQISAERTRSTAIRVNRFGPSRSDPFRKLTSLPKSRRRSRS